MSTRSAIGMFDEKTGKIKSVYCHWDGYPSHNGAILEEHYTETAKVEKLISLGSISLLAERLEPEEGEEHSFDNPVNGVVVAYHRDRKDEYHVPNVWDDEEDYVKNTERSYWAEYVYLWKDGVWMVYKTPKHSEIYDENRWNTVADALCVCGV